MYNSLWYGLWLHMYTTDLKIETGSSIYRSETKSLAAILVGLIQYIEISLGAAFSFDDCWNDMNAHH